MNSPDIDLPLYAFFDILRKNGFALGISEYKTMLDALELGFGIDAEKGELDKTKILKICKTLWLNSSQGDYIFDQLFYENFQHFPKAINKTESKQKEESESGGDGKNKNLDEVGKDNNPVVEDRSKSDIENDSIDINKPNDTTEDSDLPFVKIVFNTPTGKSTLLPDKKTKSKRKFSFSDYYFDISKRQIQQATRFLPNFQNSLNTNEIDIEASVEKFAQTGRISSPVFQRQERITNDVLLLIDSGGSMLAFEKLSTTFTEALQDSFRTQQPNNRDKVSQYYFYNVIHDFCYKNSSNTKYEKTTKVIENLNKKHSSIIILSDGGAARGGNSDGRFMATLRNIFTFKKAAHKMVWLNPLPQKRWEGTTAKRIANVIPMFSLSSQHDLQQAIKILKGK